MQVGFYGDGGVLGLGSKQLVIRDKNTFEALVKVASSWLDFCSEEEVLRKVNNKYKELDKNLLLDCISIIKNGFLTTEENNFSERYSRNRLYFSMMGANSEDAQARIMNSKVTIIGCGGIGNQIAHMLVSAGIMQITIVDDDIVELSNLTRQSLFREKDCGLKKNDVLERECKKINSSVLIKKVERSILSEKDVDSLEKSDLYDLYIVSADKPSELIYWIDSSCVKKYQAYINIGYINNIAVVGPMYIPGKTYCFSCANFTPNFATKSQILQKAIADINKNFKAPSHASTNGIASSYGFSDIVKYLGGFGDVLSVNKRIGIHTQSIKIEAQGIKLNKTCMTCGKN